jgi:DNA-directed RNA polymerase subunit B
MDKQDKYEIIKKYLEQHSLVESNITSYNNFINARLQQIVEEINEINAGLEEEIEIRLGKVHVGKPNVTEADGATNLITPTEARLRNLTYSASVYGEITIKQGNHSETQEVEIGRLPVMVKSDLCNTHGLSEAELLKNYIDTNDPGGYFIVNGNERVMVLMEDLASNQPFINVSKGRIALRIFSQKGAYKIPISISENNEGIIEVNFSRFKNIPAIVLLKALGMVKDEEIVKQIGKETDTLVVNIYEYANLQNSEDSLMHIAEKSSLQGTKKEVLDRVKQRIDSFFMPHIGVRKEDRYEKAATLCKLIKEFFTAKGNPAIKTDRDHYANKRVKLCGDLLADLFRVNLNMLVRDIRYSLTKTIKRRKIFSIKSIAKSTLFSHRVESAIATGSWIGERTGVTQNMDKTNYLSIFSQLQRISSILPGEQENFMARTLHPTHYGRFCPIETPEGTEIGLRKNLALLAKVSTAIDFNSEELVKNLAKCGLAESIPGGLDVFLNGRFVGLAGHGFMDEVKKKRRAGEFPEEIGIRHDIDLGAVFISTERGRVLRPLIIVENGQSKLDEITKERVKSGEMSWKDLVRQGVIEYLDAGEEDNALVALNEEDLTGEHTHLEIDGIASLGIITSLVPFSNHDHPPRLLRGSKTLKQALGIYAANFPVRMDTDVNILHYPQKPLVRSFVYDTLNFYPAGQNLVVAVMVHEGYNMEDATVFNKASIDRGVGRSTYFRPYTTIELNYAGGLKDQIVIPEKDIPGYRTEGSYKYLEDDGIAYPEAKMNEGEVVIGKTSPPKFLSEAREITIRTRKENSLAIRQEEKGIVDMVVVTEDNEGNKVVQVRTRDIRNPELGDKFSAPHGQKGVIGLIVPENDIPFTASGVKPDLLFNPHGIPSRMSVGYLIELLTGKIGSIKGEIMDGTAFSKRKVEDLELQLKELGFNFDGKENMYDPISGKLMTAKIYVGNMYYLKLKYMVSNKIHARGSGKVTLLTRQPVEGRAKGGALRLGEMEQQAIVAHGASLLLKERYDSDKVVIHICDKCGSIAIRDYIKNKIRCPVCGGSDAQPVEVSYAFKLLLEEIQSLHIKTNFELKNKYE